MRSTMGRSGRATPENSDDESGDAFTDADFGDSDDEVLVERGDIDPKSPPVNETMNTDVIENLIQVNDTTDNMNGTISEHGSVTSEPIGDNLLSDIRDHNDSNGSIVGILGDQHCHAEQRLAARRAARAEAREIRMRELERQQREQEDHADKAYDMYNETVGRRTGGRIASLSPSVHSPRRSSEDSDDVLSIKDLRQEMKAVEEKFRKAMILNAQLDNDKAALGYQLELLKDRIEELQEEYAQLQREHREKCSSHERLKREQCSLEREVSHARDAGARRGGGGGGPRVRGGRRRARRARRAAHWRRAAARARLPRQRGAARPGGRRHHRRPGVPAGGVQVDPGGRGAATQAAAVRGARRQAERSGGPRPSGPRHRDGVAPEGADGGQGAGGARGDRGGAAGHRRGAPRGAGGPAAGPRGRARPARGGAEAGPAEAAEGGQGGAGPSGGAGNGERPSPQTTRQTQEREVSAAEGTVTGLTLK